MNPGVSPSGALRQDFFSGDSSNSCGQQRLYRWSVGLYLPAVEIGSIVGQCQFEIAHAEIESSWMAEPPRLHCLPNSGMKTKPGHASYPVESRLPPGFA